MKLKDKLLDEFAPVTLFEMVPPAEGRPDAIERSIEEVKRIPALADAINLPEIRDENRGETRTFKFIPRVEPRTLAARMAREAGAEVLINRGVVYEAEQLDWFRETHERFGVESLVLVGGESSRFQYPGPTVLEAAQQVRAAGLPLTLGGITIPSRLGEAERIRRKNAAGLAFFTTQVLFDSNDIVGLFQSLNGLEARIFLSFAPVSQPRDFEFLRWLGVDVPQNLDQFLFQNHAAEGAPVPAEQAENALARSLDIAQRILLDVFDNLPPDPPPLGLNIMHINQRNFAPAVRMLERLGHLYGNLVAARQRASLA